MHINDIDEPHSQEKLSELSDPAAAEIVTSLHLRPCSEPGARLRVIREKRSWVSLTRHGPSSGWKSKSQLKRFRQGRNLLGNLRNLNNLEHLDIQCHLNDDIEAFKQILPPLKLSWTSHSGSLRSLSLRIPLECYQSLFHSSLLLPRLVNLTVYIFASHHSTNPVEPMCSALVPFINRHVRALESLSVITPETGTADLSPMFFNLKFFPRLTTIHLAFCALSLEYINLKGIQEFFSSHSQQLRDVVLHFSRMVGLKAEDFRAETFFALPIFRVPLFSLKSLDIGFTGFRDATGLGTISYVGRFENTLRNLILNHIQLSTAILQRLVTPLMSLRVLEIAVPYFTPAVLDILSAQLSELTDLRLSFISYSGVEGSYTSVDDTSRAHKFCAEMSRRLYPGWSLRHLKTRMITPSASHKVMIGPERTTAPNLDIYLRVLATALPGIQTIDGLRRSSLLGHLNLPFYEN